MTAPQFPLLTAGQAASLPAYGAVSAELLYEAVEARRKFPPFNSPHEGYAVLLEEVDELWDEFKANNLDAALAEAVQVGAMAIRFIADMRERAEATQ